MQYGIYRHIDTVCDEAVVVALLVHGARIFFYAERHTVDVDMYDIYFTRMHFFTHGSPTIR